MNEAGNLTLRAPRKGDADGSWACAASLPLLEGKPPREFRIFAQGINQSDYGPVNFDAVAGAMVMDAYRSKNNGPLPFDFNHGMTVKFATAEQAKKAGDFVPELRDGELWATNCRWTPETVARFEGGEYDLFSPYFDWTWPDDQTYPRVCRLMNCALVNLAGLDNLRSIAAAARMGDAEMDDKLIETQRLLDTTRTELATARAELERVKADGHARSGTMALAAVFGLAAGATVEQTTERARELVVFRDEIFRRTGVKDGVAAFGAIDGLLAKQVECDRMIADGKQREAATTKTEWDNLVAQGVKEMKIEAAEGGERRTLLLDAALGQGGGKVTREGVAYMGARLAVMSPIVGGGPAPVTPVGKGKFQLTDDIKRIAALGGVKLETVEKMIAGNNERANAG